MKTVLKNLRKAALALVTPCFLMAGLTAAPHAVFAQITSPTPPPAPVLAPTIPTAAGDSAPKIVPPPADAPDASVAAAVTPAADKEDKGNKSLGHAEDKVTDAVKDVAKRLSATDNVTLDDLNSAKQAVTKIEALIDLEKHLSELEKLRAEREGAGHSGMPGAVNASALMLPQPSMQPMPTIPTMPASVMQNPVPSFSLIDVTRITGSDGRFSAVVKTGDGQTKTVEVGDKLDGATVTAITSAGVTLEHNNTQHVLPVKNVQTVFSNTP